MKKSSFEIKKKYSKDAEVTLFKKILIQNNQH